MTQNILDKQQLRQKMRQQRRSLTAIQQNNAAQKLRGLLAAEVLFLNATNIAFYLCNDGEIDPSHLLKQAWQLEKKCFLPVLNPNQSKSLLFVHYQAGDSLTNNYYGIPEPHINPEKMLPAMELDLVLLPLVAFDCFGGRLGMGGGYYDRTFHFLSESPQQLTPKLVGLAYESQKQDKLDLSWWDIPLHAVASEQRFYGFGGKSY